MRNDNKHKATIELISLKGTFIIPRYQRGYRWDDVQIIDLLNDLYSFARETKDDDSFYFLQPLVVCKSSHNNQDSWEIIDGQQRLITIFLIDTAICKIEKRQSQLHFILDFESRPESKELLKTLIDNPDKNDFSDIDQGIEQYYLLKAFTTINKFITDLKNNEEDLERFYVKFTSKVDFLWHEVAYSNSAEAANHFTRLNRGRISLTNAELSRAILLNPANHNISNELDPFPASSKTNNYDPETQKLLNNQILCRRQILLGNQWDELERGLRKPEFWAFLGSDKQDERETRIDFLLDLYTNTDNKSDKLHAFRKLESLLRDKMKNEKDAQEIWDEITRIYKTLVSWYENHDYYHWIGYMIRRESNTVKILQEFLTHAKVETKERFIETIHKKIRESLSLSLELEKLEYDKNNETIVNILLLFNVEYARKMQMYGSNNLPDEYKQRFAFGLHGRKSTLSLDHIEAQNVKPFNKREQWDIWIGEHRITLLNLLNLLKTDKYDDIPNKDKIIQKIENIDIEIDNFQNGKNNTNEKYQEISEKIIAIIDNFEKDKFNKHGLGNLALIDKNLNSHFNNSIFLLKQEKILKLFNKGQFLPNSIEAIFMRYFNHEQMLLPYWSTKDYDNYMRQIKDTLELFLPVEQ
ncbi:MAG: DUF262 domain-containing protein [Clostridiales Family XIII bacterium]|jgi:hypothetical protein|nr:DUF262 domain-containing protein [Clostridiales Family XIII bacterium]